MQKKKVFTYFSLFSGSGGLDIGFNEIGFNSLGASDIMKESEETFKYNFPETPFIRKDIRLLSAEDILSVTNNKYPDVIIGGPPCQGFSVMGDKNSSDPRNELFRSYVRIVDRLQPKAFVFENVKGIKTMFNGRYMKEVANSFSSIGYDVYMKILNAADYGVPQKRERVIIIGTRLKKIYRFPDINNSGIGKLKAYKNVQEAIGNLIDKSEKDIINHIALNHSEKVIQRYKLIPEGGRLPKPEKLPKEIRRKNFGSTYIRLHRNELSPTMVPGNNAFPVHPVLDRSLTPREAARIQSFPDSIVFKGNRRMQCKLVGNAVPPLLAAYIAKSVSQHFNSIDELDYSNAKDLLIPRNKIYENEKSTTNNREMSFVDLFSGVGGISIGFEKAGYKNILSCDFDSSVAETYKYNNPRKTFIQGDLSSEKIKKSVLNEINGKEIDILVGGPPCQGFSIFGKRRFINTKDYDPHSDPRNKLVYTYLDYVKTIKPKWILMENVVGFISLDGGSFLKSIIKELEHLGYKNHDYKIINTADYGVPQERKRFILIANKTGHIIPWPKPKYYKNPRQWQNKFRTVGEAIADLAEEDTYSREFNHISMAHSDIVKRRMEYIEEGKKMDIECLPDDLRVAKNTGKPIKNFSHVYRRLDRNKPSITLVPGHSAFPIHPFLNRQLTVREAARIQTFPDEIIFKGSVMSQCKQVGNAFPPLAAEIIANMIKKAMINDWKEDTLSDLAKYSIVNVKY